MSTTERLLAATAGLWEKYNEHPFVKGIEEGNLDKEKFRYYIIQDYLYLIEYGKVFAIGMAKAKSPETRSLFSTYIRMLSECEMDTHRGYMGKLEITQEEIDKMPIALDNLSYTSYMLRVAYEEGEAENMAAILSCAISYEVIAKNMVRNNPECVRHPFYGEWVKSYAGEEYQEENKVLVEMFEKLTAEYTEKQIQHLADIFTVCSRYEMAFWDMAWERKK